MNSDQKNLNCEELLQLALRKSSDRIGEYYAQILSEEDTAKVLRSPEIRIPNGEINSTHTGKTGKVSPELAGFWEFFWKSLKTTDPTLYAFLNEVELVRNHKISTLGIDITHDGKISLNYNPYFTGAIIKTTEDYDKAFCLLRKLFYHEFLHVHLRHFRVRALIHKSELHDTKLMNIAQDMIIDNFIKLTFDDHDWRDWKEIIEKIGLSSDPESSNYVLKYNELEIFFLLKEKMKDADLLNQNTMDSHDLSGENEENSPSKEAGEEKRNLEDALRKIDKKLSQINQEASRLKKKIKTFAGEVPASEGEILIEAIKRGRNYNWLEILKKALVRMSWQKNVPTWKKLNKRLPYRVPGYRRNRAPGEILVLTDTSKSMHQFLKSQKFKDLINELFTTFKEVARIYGVPQKLITISTSNSGVESATEIKNPEELQKFVHTFGGGTNYEPIFRWIKDNWKKVSQSGKRMPDMVIFFSDFEVSFEFMLREEFKTYMEELSPKLFWIYTAPKELSEILKLKELGSTAGAPPFGEIVPLKRLGF